MADQKPNLPPVVQHVIDSLEAHLGAVVAHAKTASPGATAEIARFGEAVLDKLEEFGVSFRGELEDFRGKLKALEGNAGTSTGVPNTPPPPAS